MKMICDYQYFNKNIVLKQNGTVILDFIQVCSCSDEYFESVAGRMRQKIKLSVAKIFASRNHLT
jgi:hypothetical protein